MFFCLHESKSGGPVNGIDMTPAMIKRSRANAESASHTIVEFHLATIDAPPLPDLPVESCLQLLQSDLE